MLIKSIFFKSAARGAVVFLFAASPALSQTLSDANYLEALNAMAAEMGQTSLTPEPIVVDLPQIGTSVNGDLVPCAAFSAMTENEQGQLVLEGTDQQSADDQLAEIANCFAESIGEPSVTTGSIVVASGS